MRSLSLGSDCSKKAKPWLHVSKCPDTQLFPDIISFSITAACEQGPEQTLAQTALDLQGTEVTIITTIDITFGSWEKNLCLIYFLIATNMSRSPQYYGCGWLYGRFLVMQEKSMEPNKRLLKEPRDTSAVWPDSPHCRWFKQVYQRQTPLPTAPGSSGSGKDIRYSKLHTSIHQTPPGNPDVKITRKKFVCLALSPFFEERLLGRERACYNEFDLCLKLSELFRQRRGEWNLTNSRTLSLWN